MSSYSIGVAGRSPTHIALLVCCIERIQNIELWGKRRGYKPTIIMKQFRLPLAGNQHCEECFNPLSNELADKSRRRCDGKLLCFSHQMFYTSQKLRQKRLASHRTKTRSLSPSI